MVDFMKLSTLILSMMFAYICLSALSLQSLSFFGASIWLVMLISGISAFSYPHPSSVFPWITIETSKYLFGISGV